jgi:hypothetical protein
MFVYWVCCVGSGLWDELVICSEDFYQVCVSNCVWSVNLKGARDGAVVGALRNETEGRRIDSRWCHWNFSLT